MNSFISDAGDLILVCGAACGLIGAVKVYTRWQQGDPEAGIVAIRWFGALIALSVVRAAVSGVFGI